MHFRHRLAACLLLLVCGRLEPSNAQSVSGHVFQTTLSSPLSFALVQIQDPQGRVVTAGTTNSKGAIFLEVKQPGRYLWRVAAIGFAPRRLESVTVPASGVILPDVVLRPLAPQLADINAHGQRACGLKAGDAPLFDGVLDAAQTALDVMELTLASGNYGFEVKDTIILTGRATAPWTQPGPQPLANWPVHSIALEKLQKQGFSVVDSGSADAPMVRHYYGPDSQVLFTPWFLAEHCYFFDTKARSTDSIITLRFEPISKTKVDIAGEMVFDRATLSLRRLTWEHINLPKWIKKEDTGGYLEFALLDGAIWYPSRWAQKAPAETIRITGVLSPGGESRTLMGPVVGTMQRAYHVTRVIRN